MPDTSDTSATLVTRVQYEWDRSDTVQHKCDTSATRTTRVQNEWKILILIMTWLKKYFRTVCSCHVTYAFQGESTLYSCLNLKEFLARSRREIWSLSDCNWTRTHNHLVHRQTINYLAKLTKLASLVEWLSVRLWTMWLWVRVQLQSHIFELLH